MKSTWSRRHVLGLEDLSAAEITTILDEAARFKEMARHGEARHSLLKGVTICNLFFEPSTRTKTSFNLAARRLGADTVDFTAAASSLSKGETFIDTARNIEAMGVDHMVVRHSTSGTPFLLTKHLGTGVVNAGDGTHEHPTQGLLDLFTIREQRGRIEGLTVALVGDILHSRVARSNIWGLKKLGAKVIVCGPATLIPAEIRQLGVEVSYRLDEILEQTDVINLLRIQFERQRGAFFPSIYEYAQFYGMTSERIARAKSDVLILAPGPINRGVELTPDVADGPHSVILDQVTNGLFVRMATLYLMQLAREQALTST
ncbi:Aspartate carbamoyltransferase [Planctopirus ephydatiae]|jgi:aspartate carbamoyltransferase catalytic subunit|uniref:Aspartate carbamoyltransferase n=1 Tax=Planctopirus ephydatiae TaxID=2528019 RepID=A0A518GR80_9PLAN|nr:aspartate carbamoyltransferase catalytic subunit [Planctopirus ephydatiae]QDV31108.1 Aspartate carbamoyltransferase [Planctopirus ephydatiae]